MAVLSEMDRKEGLENDVGSTQEVDILPNEPDAGLSDEERKEIDRKLVRRLDWYLIPWLCLLYLLAFLDRTNIGNAKIAHLTKDIPMSTHQFNVTLTVFYISYSVFEPFANVLLKKTRPSIFIPVIMILWGFCMFGMGFIKNWSGLMAARWFLGLTEAGLFPGINYYLSCWYQRGEFGARAALFFSAAALAGSFGGLLAAAIQKMDGLGGIKGWAWIFILEGLLTVVAGIASFWMVHDFPDQAKFLSPEDRRRVILRLQRDQQSSAKHEEYKTSYLWQALTDWKTYVGMLIYMGPLMPLYSFSVFLPSIIQNFSFTSKEQVIKNQLLSVPPYALAAAATVSVGFLSDRTRTRGFFIMACAPVGIAGFIMIMASHSPAVQYLGCYLGALGIYPVIPVTIAWMANNIEGVYKRGIVLGMVIGWGNLNGVVSSNVFFDAPRYYQGHGTIIAYQFTGIFLGSLIMYLGLKRENKKKLAGERDHLIQGKTEDEIHELGDKRPDFLYTL